MEVFEIPPIGRRLESRLLACYFSALCWFGYDTESDAPRIARERSLLRIYTMTPDTFPSLFWSYTAVWAILAIYIVTLGVRLSRLEKRFSREREGSDGRK